MTMPESSVAPIPDWQQEPPLAAGIQFQQPLSAHALAPRHVFLTGATGLLGAFLLDELLRTGEATVHCLVRKSGGESGAQRLRAHLQKLGLADAAASPRVVAVEGDLTQPLLGLQPAQFAALAEQLDVIYHVGGQVNFFLPYGALRAANVLGTQEILRLAGTTTTKPVHYTSTLALFFGGAAPAGGDGCVREGDVPALDPTWRSGYTQSKWVAEQLLLAAQARGLPAAVYRTVRISGHSRTGATGNVHDLLSSLLRGCILLRACPTLDIGIAMLPADYVSRVLLHLAGQPRSLGRAFHLFHPQPCPFSDLMQLLRAAGYPLAALPYEEWLQALKRAAASDERTPPERKSLAQLWMLLNGPNSLFSPRPRYEAPYLQEGLQGSGIACPPIDEALVRGYLAFFQRVGYFPRPPATE